MTDKIKDDTATSGISCFFLFFWPFACGIIHSNERFVRSDVTSLKNLCLLWICHFKLKGGFPIVLSPLYHCWPLYRVFIGENVGTATRFGLSYQNV